MPRLAMILLVVLLQIAATFAGVWIWSESRRRRLNPVLASRSVRSTGTVTVPLPPEAAAGAVRHAMHLLKMREVPPTDGHLQAKTTTSIWRWGEEVSVILQPCPQGTSVSAKSVPPLPDYTRIVDLGQSQRNVELLLRTVYDLSQSSVRR